VRVKDRPFHLIPRFPINQSISFRVQQIEPALPAILGHKSEHSLATGPVIPDPFISPLGLTMTPALSEHIKNKTILIRARRLINNEKLTFKVKEMTLSPADSLALADDNGLKHLLPELGLTLLDGCKEHVSDGTSRESVQLGTDSTDSDHVQVLSSCVVSAVHD